MKAISKSADYNCPEPILMVFGKRDPSVFSTVVVVKNDGIIGFGRV